MNFKEKLTETFSETRRVEMEEFNKRIETMKRSDKEWEIVEEVIKETVLFEARRAHENPYYFSYKYDGLKGQWIKISSRLTYFMYLSRYFYDKKDEIKERICNGFKFNEITWMDMERFCKENNIEYRFVRKLKGDIQFFTDNSADHLIDLYLLRVTYNDEE